jgi:hypothetical protein
MGSTSVADAARQSMGPVGAYLPVPLTSAPPVDLQRVAHGDPDSIAATVGAHRTAGADHVILMPSTAAAVDLMTGVRQLEHLASAVFQTSE